MSCVQINGEEIDTAKTPITDPAKSSKRGKFSLVERSRQYLTIRQNELRPGEFDLLETVFENGELVKEYDFDEIRKLAEIKPAELANLTAN